MELLDDHVYEAALFAVNKTLSPSQMVLSLEATTEVGAATIISAHALPWHPEVVLLLMQIWVL